MALMILCKVIEKQGGQSFYKDFFDAMWASVKCDYVGDSTHAKPVFTAYFECANWLARRDQTLCEFVFTHVLQRPFDAMLEPLKVCIHSACIIVVDSNGFDEARQG
jgi:hypothetical protein